MSIELNSICADLDEVLLRALAQWKAQLEDPEACADQQSLYCLYPKLVSQISWARGMLAQVDGTLHTLRLREKMEAGSGSAGGRLLLLSVLQRCNRHDRAA